MSVFASGFTISLICYFLLRVIFVPDGWGQATASLPPISVMLKNLGIYAVALLLPIDIVLAKEWLHIPVPREIEFNISIGIALSILAIVSNMAVVLVVRRWTDIRKMIMQRIDWSSIVFLLCGIATPLLPVLVLRSRPWETYLYLPVAFYALLLSYVLNRFLWDPHTLRSQALYAAAVILLLALFCTATWIRNTRVVQCGETAHRILSSLQKPSLTDGNWRLSFANVPGERVSHRYGFYGYHGVDTIGGTNLNRDSAVTAALQLVNKNELLTGEVVNAEELMALCRLNASPHHLCFWIHWDGRVEEFQQ